MTHPTPTLLLILLLFISFGVQGQVKRDTVPCLMLASDTSAWKDSDGKPYKYTLYSIAATIRGYEVFNDSAYLFRLYHDPNHANGLGVTTLMAGYYSTETGHERTHIAYLDADKKPLKLFVWQSKTLTKN